MASVIEKLLIFGIDYNRESAEIYGCERIVENPGNFRCRKFCEVLTLWSRLLLSSSAFQLCRLVTQQRYVSTILKPAGK